MTNAESSESGLNYAYVFDGKGSARALSWSDVRAWTPSEGLLWVHLDYSAEAACEWIGTDTGLEPIVVDALTSAEARPRATIMEQGLLFALRGVNLNPGANPDDMVAIRGWVEPQRIITTRRRPLLSARDLAAALEQGRGPKDAGEFVWRLADRLVARMSETIEHAEDRVAELEELVIEAESSELRLHLATLRRQCIALRRYLAPQREALAGLLRDQVPWMGEHHRLRLHEVSDRLIRYLEDLDAVRERAAVTQEELASRLSDQLNRRMYVLSVVAAVFLPLGFLTGLLGINVGGIPGAENPHAFASFVLLLMAIVALQVWLFRS
ncbi:MAG: zinc transporter ZntB, partial [Gammaproteobacteria bacterium]